MIPEDNITDSADDSLLYEKYNTKQIYPEDLFELEGFKRRSGRKKNTRNLLASLDTAPERQKTQTPQAGSPVFSNRAAKKQQINEPVEVEARVAEAAPIIETPIASTAEIPTGDMPLIEPTVTETPAAVEIPVVEPYVPIETKVETPAADMPLFESMAEETLEITAPPVVETLAVDMPLFEAPPVEPAVAETPATVEILAVEPYIPIETKAETPAVDMPLFESVEGETLEITAPPVVETPAVDMPLFESQTTEETFITVGLPAVEEHHEADMPLFELPGGGELEQHEPVSEKALAAMEVSEVDLKPVVQSANVPLTAAMSANTLTVLPVVAEPLNYAEHTVELDLDLNSLPTYMNEFIGELNQRQAANTEAKVSEAPAQAKKKRSVLDRVLMAGAAVVLVFIVYQLYTIGLRYYYLHLNAEVAAKAEDILMASSIDMFVDPAVNPDFDLPDTSGSGGITDIIPAPPPQESEYAELINNFRAEFNNEDIIGYLTVDGTNIKYPIAHKPEDETNSYYLSHSLDKNENFAGSIFMDYQCKSDFSSYNTVIYGHNMKDSSMFHDLRYFRDKSFFNEHRYIQVITEKGSIDYIIFSCYQTSIYFNYIKAVFESRDEFGGLLEMMVKKSMYTTGIEVTQYDDIITLSTCTSTPDNLRFVIHGKRVK